jgi:hypothetical protein
MHDGAVMLMVHEQHGLATWRMCSLYIHLSSANSANSQDVMHW